MSKEPDVKDAPYQYNIFRRSLRCPGFFSARIRAASFPHGQLSKGVGDGILVEAGKSFYAVGDGSDRNPRAVRTVMELFSLLLDRSGVVRSDRMYGDEDVLPFRDAVHLSAERVIHDLYPSDGCTFTGILLFETIADGLRGLMFHSGDSLLFRIDIQNGDVQRLTENNFWFIGRTKRFYQVEEIVLSTSSRLLLATDGISNLLSANSRDPETAIREICLQFPIEQVADRFFECYEVSHNEGVDDASILFIDPSVKLRRAPAIIIGGSDIEDERRRQGRLDYVSLGEDSYENFMMSDKHSIRNVL